MSSIGGATQTTEVDTSVGSGSGETGQEESQAPNLVSNQVYETLEESTYDQIGSSSVSAAEEQSLRSVRRSALVRAWRRALSQAMREAPQDVSVEGNTDAERAHAARLGSVRRCLDWVGLVPALIWKVAAAVFSLIGLIFLFWIIFKLGGSGEEETAEDNSLDIDTPF